jgi:hydrogenase expression/formation protein HypE
VRPVQKRRSVCFVKGHGFSHAATAAKRGLGFSPGKTLRRSSFRQNNFAVHCSLFQDQFMNQGQEKPDFSNWSCPLPLADYPNIVMGHGGGGKLGNELVEHLFLPAFRNAALENLGDAAVLDLPFEGKPSRIAMSTDSFVVRPMFFPGGSIGELAVNGTVNDLAVSGAIPKYLTAGFILEEGLPLAQLAAIVADVAKAAQVAGVQIVTGDTKVVERGHGDGCYINTAGVGLIREGIIVGPHRARPGDVVLVSGSIGDHGMAILSVREGLEFESPIRSDCAALNALIASVLDAVGPQVHAMRDPTRGGLASTLNEIAASSGVGVEIDETALPVHTEVQSACELLGLDPVYVANEGKAVFFVAPEAAEEALAVLRAHPLGREAARIGQVVAAHPRMLIARTVMGSNRVIPTQIGEQLPRIC